VHYRFPSWGLLREPFLLFCGFLVFFALAALYCSIDLSLSSLATESEPPKTSVGGSIAVEAAALPLMLREQAFDNALETFNMLVRSILDESSDGAVQKLHTKLVESAFASR
jgi:hypothetical protein